MSRSPLPLLLLLTLFATATEAAPIYRTVDANGNVVFTDDPGDGDAEEVKLNDLVIVPAMAIPQGTFGSGQEEAETPQEQIPDFKVTLITPAPEASIRANSGEIGVAAKADRELRIGDKFQVVLDGMPGERNETGAFVLGNVDRGEHRVHVRLNSADGKELARSDEHVFYVHRVSALNR